MLLKLSLNAPPPPYQDTHNLSYPYLQSVTLHTTLGDLKLEIYCEEVPRTATNFLALCASGYYDKTIFHRNIKGFMIQGGDFTNKDGLIFKNVLNS